jgi:hypothetical protein
VLLSAREWQTIWLIPCIMAAVVAIAFMLLFRENKATSTDEGASGQ